jgi:ElaB/YqjD/DUF883 family membrane-anchored ribosome-binding protein
MAAAVEALKPESTVVDRVLDAARRSMHRSHDARSFKTRAADAVDDGVYAAERAIKAVRRRVDDLGDEAVHRVKRHPVTAMGIAVGAGLAVGLSVGMGVGWLAGRFGGRKRGLVL